MQPEKKGPPQKELALKPFIFSFTTVIEKRLEEMEVTPEEAVPFCKSLNGFLTAVAESSQEIGGIGLTTENEKKERLPLITVDTYFKRPMKSRIAPISEEFDFIDKSWREPPPPSGDILVIFGITGTLHSPTYETFLENLIKDTSIGFTGAPKKFLGAVKTSALRQELQNPNSQNTS